MVKTPKEKVDIDDFDSVEEYIGAAMSGGWTLEAEDFEGRDCAYCGETIPFDEWSENVVMWDIPVQEPGEEATGYYMRRYFCSDGCKREFMCDGEMARNGSPHQDADELHEREMEEIHR